MRVLVTGAAGFVGASLVRRLLRDGHEVTGTRGGTSTSHESRLAPADHEAVHWLPLDLTTRSSIEAVARGPYDAVVHLAGLSGSVDAEKDAGHAWDVNAGGTARLLEAIVAQAGATGWPPRVLVVSSSEVYGPGEGRPSREADPVRPVSVYAASKAAAEIAAGQAARRYGLPVVVARPWPHTGPGQTDRLVPKWVAALRSGQAELGGDPTAVRDFLDVRDVVEAYLALLDPAVPGGVYNVATGRPVAFGDLLARICDRVGARAHLRPDRSRTWDTPYSVGDATRLREATGWSPRFTLDQTLDDLIDAETH